MNNKNIKNRNVDINEQFTLLKKSKQVSEIYIFTTEHWTVFIFLFIQYSLHNK